LVRREQADDENAGTKDTLTYAYRFRVVGSF
jgi:hypothetical protein